MNRTGEMFQMRRLSTYLRFPPGSKVSPILLASSGFSYIGEGESETIQCCGCQVVLKHFQSLNDLEAKHRTVSPDCNVFSQLRAVVKDAAAAAAGGLFSV